jgi:hypothetical protein
MALSLLWSVRDNDRLTLTTCGSEMATVSESSYRRDRNTLGGAVRIESDWDEWEDDVLVATESRR